MKLRHTLIAAALMTAAMPAAAQQFSNVVFFGDSLTDSGYFRPALIQQAGSGAAVVGKFTTNPYLVWSEQLALKYGINLNPSNQGGSNYAVGGARAGVDVTGALGPIPSVTTQVSNYLKANGGKADPNALYSVWAGGNDMLAVLGGAPAQATIGAAVQSEVTALATLKAAGAQYILLPILPDLGMTPTALAGGAATIGAATGGSQSYNQALLAGAQAAGVNIIPVDTFSLLREVKANAAAFGYTNTTGTACGATSSLTCAPANYVAPGASESYLFADGVHPTGKTHTIMAQLAYSMVAAPYQQAMVSKAALNVGTSRADRVFGASGSGSKVWADVRGNFNRYDHGKQFNSDGVGLLVGGTFGDNMLKFGPFVGFGKQTNKFGESAGNFDQKDTTLGAYLRYGEGNGAWGAAQVSYSKTSANVDRKIALGPVTRIHSGSRDGSNITVGAQGGYMMGEGALKHGPFLSVVSQSAKSDGYTESDPTLSTALSYDDVTAKSLAGRIGYKMEMNLTPHMAPYASIAYNREFKKDALQAHATSMTTGVRYAVPAPAFDRDYAVINIGAKTKVLGFAADVGLAAGLGEKDAQQATVYATFGF